MSSPVGFLPQQSSATSRDTPRTSSFSGELLLRDETLLNSLLTAFSGRKRWVSRYVRLSATEGEILVWSSRAAEHAGDIPMQTIALRGRYTLSACRVDSAPSISGAESASRVLYRLILDPGSIMSPGNAGKIFRYGSTESDEYGRWSSAITHALTCALEREDAGARNATTSRVTAALNSSTLLQLATAPSPRELLRSTPRREVVHTLAIAFEDDAALCFITLRADSSIHDACALVAKKIGLRADYDYSIFFRIPEAEVAPLPGSWTASAVEGLATYATDVYDVCIPDVMSIASVLRAATDSRATLIYKRRWSGGGNARYGCAEDYPGDPLAANCQSPLLQTSTLRSQSARSPDPTPTSQEESRNPSLVSPRASSASPFSPFSPRTPRNPDTRSTSAVLWTLSTPLERAAAVNWDAIPDVANIDAEVTAAVSSCATAHHLAFVAACRQLTMGVLALSLPEQIAATALRFLAERGFVNAQSARLEEYTDAACAMPIQSRLQAAAEEVSVGGAISARDAISLTSAACAGAMTSLGVRLRAAHILVSNAYPNGFAAERALIAFMRAQPGAGSQSFLALLTRRVCSSERGENHTAPSAQPTPPWALAAAARSAPPLVVICLIGAAGVMVRPAFPSALFDHGPPSNAVAAGISLALNALVESSAVGGANSILNPHNNAAPVPSPAACGWAIAPIEAIEVWGHKKNMLAFTFRARERERLVVSDLYSASSLEMSSCMQAVVYRLMLARESLVPPVRRREEPATGNGHARAVAAVSSAMVSARARAAALAPATAESEWVEVTEPATGDAVLWHPHSGRTVFSVLV